MTKGLKNKKRFVVHVSVLQNGAMIAEQQLQLNGRRRIVLRNGSGHGLFLPHYPLPDGKIELGNTGKNQVAILPPVGWSGYITSKGVVADINPSQPLNSAFQLRQGDYGVLQKGDLQVLIRLGDARPNVGRDRHITTTAGRGSLRRLVFRDPQAVSYFAGALLVVLCVFGSALAGAMMNKSVASKKLTDLPDEYVLPFIHPDHFELGPEYLQKNLDRAYWEQSVLNYQKSFAALLLGKRSFDEKFHSPSTIATYDQAFRETDEKLELATIKQTEVDDRILASDDDGLLVIPAIRGETVGGSALRLLDKLEIHAEAMRIKLGAKSLIKQEFESTEPYDYENYNRRQNYSDQFSQVTKQINTFGGSTDEDAMYKEGMDRAKAASDFRAKIHAADDQQRLTFVNHRPLAMPIGSKIATFRQDFDLGMLDSRLDDIPATVYGTKPKRVKKREPLTGYINRDLVEDFIRRNRFQLQLCYELALRRDERARGRMEWKWRINSRGQISEIDLVSSTIEDRRMVGCVRRKIAAWRFPRPTAGQSVEIRYPFDFQPSRG